MVLEGVTMFSFFLFFFCEGLLQNGRGGSLVLVGTLTNKQGLRGNNSEVVYKIMLVHTLKKVAKLKYSYS